MTQEQERANEELGAKVVGNISFPVTQELMNDIITTAFEGGSNYWCGSAIEQHVRPNSDPLAHDYYTPEGFHWKLYDVEDGEYFGNKKDEFPNYRDLTLESFLQGFQQYMNERGNPYGSHLDGGNFDAIEAEIVLQYAVFGEIIFG